jgi:hypothetical protein
MFKAVVEHMKNVEAAIKKMPLPAGFAFALSCTERQWPVFERALNEQPSLMTGRAVFRKATDLAWEYCLHGTPVPNEYLVECRREIPDQAGDAPSAVVHTISNSIVDLLNAIQRNDGAYPHHLSGRNLGLIEMLLDEHGLLLDNLAQDEAQDSTEVKQIRLLVKDEIQHQNQDLQRLSADASSSTIEAVRNKSTGKSLFDGVWFS